jgi:hypothetical protein
MGTLVQRQLSGDLVDSGYLVHLAYLPRDVHLNKASISPKLSWSDPNKRIKNISQNHEFAVLNKMVIKGKNCIDGKTLH